MQRAAGLAQREVERRRLERPVAEAQRHVPLRRLRPQLERGEVVAEAGQRPLALERQRGPGLVQRGAVLAEHRDVLAQPVGAGADEPHVRRDALELVGEDGVQAVVLARLDDERQLREPRPQRLAAHRRGSVSVVDASTWASRSRQPRSVGCPDLPPRREPAPPRPVVAKSSYVRRPNRNASAP